MKSDQEKRLDERFQSMMSQMRITQESQEKDLTIYKLQQETKIDKIKQELEKAVKKNEEYEKILKNPNKENIEVQIF